ncbi:hypothetical protein BVX98_01310 [bacterium F11]|nr:hypothetical protein BVX98_01310 [bacterium F11]
MNTTTYNKEHRIRFQQKVRSFGLAIVTLVLGSQLLLAGHKTGLAFLKIPVGARGVGLGSAYTALANDVSGMFWNPGGLPTVSSREVGLFHTDSFEDVNFDVVGLALPSKWGTFGLGVSYLSQGELEGRDIHRQKTGSFEASDLSVNVAYGRTVSLFSQSIHMGGNVKAIQSRLADESAETVALDLGIIHGTPISRLNMGWAVQNMGPGVKFDQKRYPLPLTLSAGLAYAIPFGLGLTMDLKHQPHDNITTTSLGAEYSVMSFISVRGGYMANLAGQVSQLGSSADPSTQLKGLGGGIGLAFSRFNVDYSFTPFDELGDVQRVNLSAKF